MKHAGGGTLKELAPLLEKIRALEGPVERKPGIFYLKGIAFLHFHEDPAGLFADVKSAGGWTRVKVSPKLPAQVRKALASFERRG
jgi:hypothetical protein